MSDNVPDLLQCGKLTVSQLLHSWFTSLIWCGDVNECEYPSEIGLTISGDGTVRDDPGINTMLSVEWRLWSMFDAVFAARFSSGELGATLWRFDNGTCSFESTASSE